jgi:hypothetical protein
MEAIAAKVEQEEAAKASSDKLDRLKELVKEAGGLQEEIREVVELLKVRIGRFNRIKQYELPEIMKASETGKYETVDGRIKVKLDQYVSGSLPKDEFDKEQAIQYLQEIDGGNLIKATVECDFPKTMHNVAQAVMGVMVDTIKQIQKEMRADVEAAGGTYEPEDLEPILKETVHAQSLQAFGRERLKKGKETDFAKLGLATGDIAKFEFFGEDGKKLKAVKIEDL